MKKQILFLAALLAITAGTTLAALPLEVNGPISDKLRSLENGNTKASLELVSLEASEARATAATFRGSFEKTGSKNSVRLNLENASYGYGDGSGPTTRAVGALELDLTKTLPRYQINLFVPQLDSLLAIALRQ